MAEKATLSDNEQVPMSIPPSLDSVQETEMKDQPADSEHPKTASTAAESTTSATPDSSTAAM